jgi:maltose O-acetyltransferase
MMGAEVDKCWISPKVWLGSTNLSIGRDTFINYGCMLDGTGRIDVGSRCDIGMQTLFVTSSHILGSSDRRAGALTTGSIEIGDGTWIGARAVILPGVKIGEGAVVAAGAVVTRDCEGGWLHAGTPARKIRLL